MTAFEIVPFHGDQLQGHAGDAIRPQLTPNEPGLPPHTDQ
ncbi:hypothetical protein P3T21_007195 [Paraburkholderia sp. GAS334]